MERELRLLIIGGNGMLGHKLFQGLGKQFPDTYTTIRREITDASIDRIPFFQNGKVIEGVDVSDFVKLTEVMNEIRPDYTVNCAGIIKQRKEDMSPFSCITVNSLLPHKLSEIASSFGGRVIHFSTDCVFDGKKGGYTESDLPNALDLYGRTKALGELTSDNGLTLRTSIIGRELDKHTSLLDWFLSQNGKAVKGFTKAIYSGVTTLQMVRVISMIIEKFPNLTGLYQVVAEPISKYELLKLIREYFDISVQIEPDDKIRIDRSMSGDKFKCATNYQSPPWPQLIHELADDNLQYSEWGIKL